MHNNIIEIVKPTGETIVAALKETSDRFTDVTGTSWVEHECLVIIGNNKGRFITVKYYSVEDRHTVDDGDSEVTVAFCNVNWVDVTFCIDDSVDGTRSSFVLYTGRLIEYDFESGECIVAMNQTRCARFCINDVGPID